MQLNFWKFWLMPFRFWWERIILMKSFYFGIKSPLRLKLHYLANTNIWNIKYEEEINEIEEKQILTSSRAYFTISACYLLSNKIEKTFWAVQVSLPNWQPTTAHLAWRIDVGLISQQLPHDLRMTFLRSYP